jgi:phenylacetate-coenzyme A ligase PaaK-like adenylate-forming protein
MEANVSKSQTAQTMKATDKLLNSDPFDFSPETKSLFLESFKENALHHYHQHEFTRKFWDKLGFHPSSLEIEDDLQRVPGTMVHLFKEHELCSVPKEDLVLTLTSSGTGGQKSRQFLDERSLANVKKLALMIHQSLGMANSEKYNYLCFTYDPKVANDLGTAFTDELLTNFTGKNEVYYAIQWDSEKNDFYLNEAGVVETLKRFADSKLMTRILGFPAFLYEILEKHQIKLDLGADSWLQTGGGWKGKADKEIPKKEFRKFIQERLGIPEKNQRDLFGMVEHGIPYVDCEWGNLHIPNYARVYIRSPQDLSLRPKGEKGLLHFLCSYNFSYPAPSLLTTDYGRLGSCNCGIGGDTLILEGRAGVSKHKGCALKALELLEKN